MIKQRKYGEFMKRDTVLIFEDNAIDRAILTELFQADYKILEADNGKSGLALLNSHYQSIAIVLLDYLMPVMDGFAVLERLKDKNILNKIPLIQSMYQGYFTNAK